MLSEFKKFAMRGNVVDLAVGIIIGAAFGKIVTSFVNDIIMPPIGILLGKVDFSNLFINLSGKNFESISEAKRAGAAVIGYGVFLNTVLDFMIVALAVFMLVRSINKLKPTDAIDQKTTRECPFCLSTVSKKACRCPACTSALDIIP